MIAERGRGAVSAARLRPYILRDSGWKSLHLLRAVHAADLQVQGWGGGPLFPAGGGMDPPPRPRQVARPGGRQRSLHVPGCLRRRQQWSFGGNRHCRRLCLQPGGGGSSSLGRNFVSADTAEKVRKEGESFFFGTRKPLSVQGRSKKYHSWPWVVVSPKSGCCSRWDIYSTFFKVGCPTLTFPKPVTSVVTSLPDILHVSILVKTATC